MGFVGRIPNLSFDAVSLTAISAPDLTTLIQPKLSPFGHDPVLEVGDKLFSHT